MLSGLKIKFAHKDEKRKKELMKVALKHHLHSGNWGTMEDWLKNRPVRAIGIAYHNKAPIASIVSLEPLKYDAFNIGAYTYMHYRRKGVATQLVRRMNRSSHGVVHLHTKDILWEKLK